MSSPAASASPSVRTMQATGKAFSITQTPRSIAPRPKAAPPIASSRREWAQRYATAEYSSMICVRPSLEASSRLVYQPQEDIETKGTVGFEALLRWKHRTVDGFRRWCSSRLRKNPGPFSALASGCCARPASEAASWPQPLTIAVNVSAVQIYNENFVQLVHEVLLETGLRRQADSSWKSPKPR